MARGIATAVASRQRGVTLIELMVALTLFGVIAILLSSGTRLSLDVSARGNRKAEAIRTQQIEMAFLRSQLEGALPFRYWTEIDEKRMEHLAFIGGPDHLRFVSRHGLLDGPDNLPRWVDLGRQGLEERRILSPDNQPAEAVIARAQIASCKEMGFDYLDPTGEKPAWLSNWDASQRRALPSAVRIRCKEVRDPVNLLAVPLDYADSARQGLWFQ